MLPAASSGASRDLHPCTSFHVQIERFSLMYGSNFTGWPIQPNHISEIVKEPLWANAESILLLPFSAQSYIHIILKIAIRGNSSPPQAVRFSCQEIHKLFESGFTIKIERLLYQGLLGQPGNIKFEVDHHQNVLLPGIKVNYRNVWNEDALALVMDKREICSEKIRAVSQRARHRDFYDLYFSSNRS